MAWLWNLNLIHFLDFYFMFTFFASTFRRYEQYQNIVKLVWGGPRRWPLLLNLMREHRTIFMTWATVAPAVLALALSIVQLIASRGLWPEAGEPPSGLTVGNLLGHWAALFVVVPLGLGMLAVDIKGLIVIGRVDRQEMEKYFDQAEYWLRSRTAHVVRVATLGFINPRRMVAEEVRKALIAAIALLNTTLWWVNLQVSLRFAFGLSLWLTWALPLAFA
jgi:hypothetical protein